MTYRVYLRHPQQRVSDKTTTEDRATAMVALARLCVTHSGHPDTAAVMTCDGRGVDYIELAALRRCDECGHMMPMMDHGECPYCWLANPPLLPCPVCHGLGYLDNGDTCGYCIDGCVEGSWDIPIG